MRPLFDLFGCRQVAYQRRRHAIEQCQDVWVLLRLPACHDVGKTLAARGQHAFAHRETCGGQMQPAGGILRRNAATAQRRGGIAAEDAAGRLHLTAVGLAMRERVLAARRKGLSDIMARWQPEKHPDVLALLDRMTATLVRDLPAPEQLEERAH